MLPATVDNHLDLVRAIFFRVAGYELHIPRYHAEELAIAEKFENGEIHWVDQPPRSVSWGPRGVEGA